VLQGPTATAPSFRSRSPPTYAAFRITERTSRTQTANRTVDFWAERVPSLSRSRNHALQGPRRSPGQCRPSDGPSGPGYPVGLRRTGGSCWCAEGNVGVLEVGADSARCTDVRGEEQRRLGEPYSITSSAVASSVGGTSMPSALAVCRLMTNSNLVDCTTGRSEGLAPLVIWPV
jgi:hypothetical protein